MMQTYKIALLIAVLLGGNISGLLADDWPMLGRDATRNAVSLETNPPLTWDIGKFDRRTGQWIDRGSNVRWKADLGRAVYASPVISDGLVWIGANRQGMEAKPTRLCYAAIANVTESCCTNTSLPGSRACYATRRGRGCPALPASMETNCGFSQTAAKRSA